MADTTSAILKAMTMAVFKVSPTSQSYSGTRTKQRDNDPADRHNARPTRGKSILEETARND